MGTHNYAEIKTDLSAVVKKYLDKSKIIGRDAVRELIKSEDGFPDEWPNGAHQKSIAKYDGEYCRLEPARKFGEILWESLTIDGGSSLRGNRLKFSGVLQEIVLGNIIQEFITSLGKASEYVVLHDQSLLPTENRFHRCDLAIVKKDPENKNDSLEYYRDRTVLFIECKSNLNKKSIFTKFWKDTNRDEGDADRVEACIVAREPDGNLNKLFNPTSTSKVGLKEIFNDMRGDAWLNATEEGINLREDSYIPKEDIPVFFIPDGGGMYRLLRSAKEEEQNDCEWLSEHEPAMPWFGISGLLHYVLSCLERDEAFIDPTSWENIKKSLSQTE
jgi:hypothetical protein